MGAAPYYKLHAPPFSPQHVLGFTEMFNNLKLRTILLGGFVIVALFSVIVGFIGIRNMGTISEMTDRMYDRELMAVSYVKEANINLVYIGRDWRTALLATTPEERSKAVKAFAEHARTVQDYLDKARPMFFTEQGKAEHREDARPGRENSAHYA